MLSSEFIDSAVEVPRAFLRSATDHLSVLREALLFDDNDRARMTARSLKRMSGAMASWRMRLLAGQLERLGTANLGQALAILKALDSELDDMRRAVQA
jgi:HPt (histidine-containing phosphotransfer) domain-containing protein